MDKLNILIAIKKIEFIIKELLRNKSLGPYGFSGEFSQIFNQEFI